MCIRDRAFTAHAASVLATCSAAPPVLLKSGGVGARELSRISKAAQCDDIVVRLVLETAYDAGLLAQDGDRVAATDGYDTWAEREPAEQLTALLHTWRTLPLTPGPGPRRPFGTGVPYGTDTEEIVAAYAKNLACSDVRQLAHAVDVGTAITVEYVAASGNRTVRILSELVLDPPYLYAWCRLRDDQRVFTLSRIHGIMPG